MLITYSATNTTELGHPDSAGALSVVIEQLLSTEQINSLELFHARVYDRLWRIPEFANKKFQFKYTLLIDNAVPPAIVEMGESENLLFWLVANKKQPFVKILLENCGNASALLVDSQGNNLLHIAAAYGAHEIVAVFNDLYMHNKVSYEVFSELINGRNKNGSTMLGLAFINPLNKIKPAADKSPLFKIIEILVIRTIFRVNAYLNNKKGMDYQGEDYLQKIGGYNCLHMALKEGLEGVLDLLHGRNIHLLAEGRDLDALTNFRFPSLNPRHHMTSPERFIAGHLPLLKNKLLTYQQEQDAREDGDTSGDSDDEESSATLYKKSLLDLQQVISHNNAAFPAKEVAEQQRLCTFLNESHHMRGGHNREMSPRAEVNKIVIPHFHGTPFMAGHYTHQQRRTVARQILSANGQNHHLRSLHSRTSTSTVGFENLSILMNSSQELLLTLDQVDDNLRNYLSECWKINRDQFILAVATYVYNFSDNPIAEFWNQLYTIKAAPGDIVKYRFPFVSTSKAPDHPTKFAFGVNVETQQRGERPFLPKYDANGKPNHRLVGFLYITFHSYVDLRTMEEGKQYIDMPQLIKHDIIKSQATRTNNQLEVIFPGGIKNTQVVAIIPIVYPNFSKAFQTGYHDKIWYLFNAASPGNSVNHFLNAKRILKGKDINLYKSGKISSAGRVLMAAYVQFALDLAQAIAKSHNKTLCYLAADGSIHPYPKGYIKGNVYLSVAQQQIREPINSLTGAYHIKIPEKALLEPKKLGVLAKEIYVESEISKEKASAIKLLLAQFFRPLKEHIAPELESIIHRILSFLLGNFDYNTIDHLNPSMFHDGIQCGRRRELAGVVAKLARINEIFCNHLLVLLAQTHYQRYKFFLETALMVFTIIPTSNKNLLKKITECLKDDDLYVRAYAAEALIRSGVVSKEIIDIIDVFKFSYRCYRLTHLDGTYEDCPESPHEAMRNIGLFNLAQATKLKELMTTHSGAVSEESVKEYIELNTFDEAILWRLLERPVGSLVFSELGVLPFYIAKDTKKVLQRFVVIERAISETVILMQPRSVGAINYQPTITKCLISLLKSDDWNLKVSVLSILLKGEYKTECKELLQNQSWHSVDKMLRLKMAILYLQVEKLMSPILKIILELTQDDDFATVILKKLAKISATIVAENDIIDELLSLAEDENIMTRRVAILLLEKIKKNDDIIKFLFTLLEYEEDPKTSFHIAKVLVTMREDASIIIDTFFWLLNSSQDSLGLLAASELIQLGIITSEVLARLFKQCVAFKPFHFTHEDESFVLLNKIEKIKPYLLVLEELFIIEWLLANDQKYVNISLIHFTDDNYARVAKLLLYPEKSNFLSIENYFIHMLSAPEMDIIYYAANALIKMKSNHAHAKRLVISMSANQDSRLANRATIARIYHGEIEQSLADKILIICESKGLDTTCVQALGKFLENVFIQLPAVTLEHKEIVHSNIKEEDLLTDDDGESVNKILNFDQLTLDDHKSTVSTWLDTTGLFSSLRDVPVVPVSLPFLTRKLPNAESVIEVDVPRDGNCFYTALLLATLQLHVDSNTLFAKHCTELLGANFTLEEQEELRRLLASEYDGTIEFYSNHPIINQYTNAYLRPQLARWVESQRNTLSEFYSVNELNSEIDNINTPTKWADDLSVALVRRLFTTLGKRLHVYQMNNQLTEVYSYDAAQESIPQDPSPVHLVFTGTTISNVNRNHYRFLIDPTCLPDCLLKRRLRAENLDVSQQSAVGPPTAFARLNR